MDVIAINYAADGLSGLPDALPAIGALPTAASVTILIHGYRFSPSHPRRSPHSHILGRHPRPGCWKAISWPRHLHLDRSASHLGLAFGWPAVGRLPTVAARAFAAGEGLAHLLHQIHGARPDLHLNLFAHSLGARVALQAIRLAPPRSVHRAILLSGAEYRDHARAALAAPGGGSAHVINVRSAANLPFDLAFRALVPAPHLLALPLAAGLAAANWTDLSIDSAATRAHLLRLGHRIPAPALRFCHWSGYLRPGLFPLYRRLLDPAEAHLPHALRPAVQPHSGPGETRLSPS